MDTANRPHRPHPLTTFAALAETADAPVPDASPLEPVRWRGVLGMEGVRTGDGRIIAAGALTWPDGMLPLRAVHSDVGAHDGAVVVGSIFSIERDEATGEIRAEGDFDLTSEEGREAARLVGEGRLTGVSFDLDDTSFEVQVLSEVLDPALAEEPEEVEEPEDEETDRVVDEEGEERVVVHSQRGDTELMVITAARVRAATLVAIPAFEQARIEIDADAPPLPEALAASAAPIEPPRAWFDDPALEGPTPLSVTDDGRVFGHLATWDVCHTASPAGQGVCVTAPRSATGYARFHTGSVKLEDGGVIATGRITMGTGHANPRLGAAAAAEHYDHTGTAVADVRCGEDAFGIWVAGALRPDVTPEQVRALRGSPLSGDWRRVDGSLELHAALAVNTPGFPVPRPQGLIASGQLDTLLASGLVPPQMDEAEVSSQFTAGDLRYLARLLAREREAERIALRARVDRVRVERFRATLKP